MSQVLGGWYQALLVVKIPRRPAVSCGHGPVNQLASWRSSPLMTIEVIETWYHSCVQESAHPSGLGSFHAV